MAYLGITADPAGLTVAGPPPSTRGDRPGGAGPGARNGAQGDAQGGARGGALDRALAAALDEAAPGAPVVVLVHGWKFDPGRPGCNPHASLFAPRPAKASWKVRSWPAELGYGPGAAGGLCIGFGWPATAAHLPALLAEGRTGFARVYDRAATVGAALADLLRRLHRLAPWRRVDVLAHSLGARVALAALPHLDRAPRRMLLLGAAEFDARALAFLAAGPRPGPAIYNVTARSNDFYDAAFETFAPRRSWHDRAVGLGLAARLPNWLDLQLDRAEVTDWVNGRGIPLAPAEARFCHWTFYTRPGAFALYRAILERRPGWDIPSLRAEPCFADQEPRWSRILPRRRARRPVEAPALAPAEA